MSVGSKTIYACGSHLGEDEDLVSKGKLGKTSMEYTDNENGEPTLVVQGVGTPITTIDEMFAHADEKGFPDDLDRFAVTHYKRRTWTTPMKLGNAEDGFHVDLIANFYVAATFGLKKPMDDLRAMQRDIIEDIRAVSQDTVPERIKRPEAPVGKRSVMFEPAVVDLHLGNLVWGKECGEDWDMRIAEAVFKMTVRSLVAEALDSASLHIEEIVWIVGNDFMHADGKEAKTTAGTQLALDNRWPKLFRKAHQLQRWAIDLLRTIAPVKVIVIPGNHDELSAFTVGEVLWAVYEHTEDVHIDNGPKPRKYVMYGNTLIGMTHGNHERLNQLPALMHADRDAMPYLSAAEYKEFHVGHYHHRKGIQSIPSHEDQRGVLVRILPSITATDDWHFQKGFVGSVKASEGYLYCRESGLIRVVHSQRTTTLSDDG